MVRPVRKLFVEGGGDHNHALRIECRRAFTRLFEKAGLEGRKPRVVPCGSRQKAFDQFREQVENGEKDSVAILLVDSEALVSERSPWRHVETRRGDEWKKPPSATDDQLHLMVQCMESWFLADPNALESYFGKGFKRNALSGPDAAPETVDKADLFRQLQAATQDCAAKGYHKGRHSFALLERLDPRRLRHSCPWAKRFFSTLERLL